MEQHNDVDLLSCLPWPIRSRTCLIQFLTQLGEKTELDPIFAGLDSHQVKESGGPIAPSDDHDWDAIFAGLNNPRTPPPSSV
jgi:hypothetical protein